MNNPMNNKQDNNHLERENIGRGEREMFAHFRSHKLSVEEKSAMRQTLQNVVIENRPKIGDGGINPRSFLSLLFGRSFAVSFLVVLLVVGSGYGVAQAANQALPGEILYPMKTQFNEPLIGSFKRSRDARAEWERTRVERRIAEVERLVSEGKLGDAERNDVEQALTRQRKTIEQIEGREIDDDEFVSQEADDTKNIRIRTEYQERKVRIHIEERESEDKDKDNENEISRERVRGEWKERGSSYENRDREDEENDKKESFSLDQRSSEEEGNSKSNDEENEQSRDSSDEEERREEND